MADGSRGAPWGIVALDIVWIGGLGFLLLNYLNDPHSWTNDVLPHDPVGGLVPLVVPWAGALGGTTISLTGAAKHAGHWLSRMTIWHLIRPVLGAVIGTLAYLMVAIVLRTAGGISDGTDIGKLGPVAYGLFMVIAFVAGFRESVFRLLISRVVDVIIGPGDTAVDISYAVDHEVLDFGKFDGAEAQTRTVRILNTGTAVLSLDKNWAQLEHETAAPKSGFQLDGSASSTGRIPVNGFRKLDVKLTPTTANTDYVDTLRIDVSGMQTVVSVKAHRDN
ncbi:hypothetical protein AB0E69_07720 [Kribbella sp. NPDC026611]|uniref:hypothetical protein n=1 Tax=Kribbella sp. NPDC026611 TaxID=3154911 RepID=UPI0033CF5FE8